MSLKQVLGRTWYVLLSLVWILITVWQEIETWVLALKHYDANDFTEALEQFDLIADTAKIFFNIGVIHATLGEHEKAVSCRAVPFV